MISIRTARKRNFLLAASHSSVPLLTIIETMTFVVYKSSAGSGKTYSLVKEYIILALSRPDNYSKILAVTFTNKAANELKQRILTNLRQLANPAAYKQTTTVKSMLPELCIITSQTFEELSRNAGLILSRILHSYSDFAITTIDSFVNRIIRTFARDLKLPLNFEVEMNSSRLLDQAIDRLIARVGSDKQLTDILIEYTVSMTDSEKGWNIAKDMAGIGKLLFDEQGMLKAEKLKELSLNIFTDAEKTMIAFRRAFEKHIMDIAKEATALILSKGIDNNSFYYGKQGIGSYFSNLANGRMDKLAPNTRVLKTVEEDCWYVTKTNTDQVVAIQEISGVLGDFYLAITKYASGANLQRYKLFGLLVFNLYPLALLSEMEKEIALIRAETNIVHISEFNRRIAEIVMNEPVPFIYERLGEKFHHYLIDEFQDTSRLQWMNLLPLLENSLASGYFNMIVGDGKQAIYRWRSGHVEQFVNLPFIENTSNDEYLHQREAILKQNYLEKLLDTNYRSQQGIVNFNNDFFECAASILSSDLQRVYEHSRQSHKSNAVEGFVSLEFVDKGPEGEKVAERILMRTLELVKSLMTEHNYALNDIVVLTRSRKDGSLIANYLVDAGIPVVSSESLLLMASPEVKVMVALLRILLNPADKVAVVEAMHLLAKWSTGSSETLHEVWSGVLQNTKDEAAIPQVGFIDFLWQMGIDFNTNNLLRLPLYDLCENLIRMFGLNKNPNVYLQFFLDVVHKQSSVRGMGLSSFLEFWDEQQAELSVVVPEQLDAVRIMTIHKAKGLEFPVVIFPFASSDARTNRNYLWIDINEPLLEKLPIAIVKAKKEMVEAGYADVLESEAAKTYLDLLNMMYVAMTRPIDRLYILSTIPPKISDTVSMPTIFKKFLAYKGIWQDDRTVYTFGEELPNIPKTGALQSNVYQIEQFISIDWRSKLRLAGKAPSLWNIDDPSRNRQWGNLVHTLLSRLTTSDQLDEMFAKMKFEGLIQPEQETALLQKAKEVVKHPLLVHLFASGIGLRSEAELLLPDGSTYRPDRVVLAPNETVILEYKTGAPRPQHREQVNAYADILLQMGYAQVRKLLVYLDDEVRVEEC